MLAEEEIYSTMQLSLTRCVFKWAHDSNFEHTQNISVEDEKHIIYLIENGCGWHETTKYAIENFEIEMSLWLISLGKTTIDSLIEDIVLAGNIIVLSWVHDKYRVRDYNNILKLAIVHSSTCIIEWAIDKGATITEEMCDYVLKHGSLSCFKIICNRGLLKSGSSTWHTILNGHWDLFEYAIQVNVQCTIAIPSKTIIGIDKLNKVLEILQKNDIFIQDDDDGYDYNGTGYYYYTK